MLDETLDIQSDWLPRASVAGGFRNWRKSSMSSQGMTYATALAPLRGWPNTRMPYFTRLEPLSGAKNIAHGASRGLHATKKGIAPKGRKTRTMRATQGARDMPYAPLGLGSIRPSPTACAVGYILDAAPRLPEKLA
jgi:hypothetical protein